MIGTEERDYERIEPSIRGIGYQEGERGKAHDGAGRKPEPSVEKIRFKSEERLETNNPIMTVKKLVILDTTVTLIKEIGDTNESKLQYT